MKQFMYLPYNSDPQCWRRPDTASGKVLHCYPVSQLYLDISLGIKLEGLVQILE